MVRNSTLFLTTKFQLINMEGVMDVEKQPLGKHHSNTVAGKYHQWMLRLIIRLMRNRLLQFSSVTQSCLTLCDPMNHSMPGLPVHHQLLEFTQTHAH